MSSKKTSKTEIVTGIFTLVVVILLSILTFQMPSITSIKTDLEPLKSLPGKVEELNTQVTNLNSSLGQAPKQLSEQTDKLTRITENFANQKDIFTQLSGDFKTSQKELNQSITDLAVLNNKVDNIDKTITRVEKNLQNRLPNIETNLAKLGESVSNLTSRISEEVIPQKKYSNFENQILSSLDDLNEKVDNILTRQRR